MKKEIHILLVDDDEIDREALRRYIRLEKLPYQLSEAASREEAVKMLETQNFDIVLLDYNLGDTTGIEILSLIEEMPAIFVTGSGNEEIAVNAMRSGAYDYLIKDPEHNYLTVLPLTIQNVLTVRKNELERSRLLERLSSKNKEMETLLKYITHDLCSPLSNIKGFQSVIKDECKKIGALFQTLEEQEKEKALHSKDRVCRSLDYIDSSLNKLDSMIRLLSEFTREGYLPLNAEPLNMDNLIKQIINTMRFRLNEQDIALTVEQLPNCIGDNIQINRIFSNLIDNAIKYLSPKRKGKISITGKTKGGTSTYCIQDNGIGIPTTEHKKIFRIFHRVTKDSTIQGDGIGLAAIKTLIERHNGEIWLESTPNQGSCFYISLPTE